jgi:hypothetical protein
MISHLDDEFQMMSHPDDFPFYSREQKMLMINNTTETYVWDE